MSIRAALVTMLVSYPLAQDPGNSAPAEPTPAPSEPAPQTVLVGAHGTLNLPAGWKWLPDAQGQRFLESLGNPDDPDVLGVAIREEAEVFVVFSYEDDGHVEDADAAGLDYDALLHDMQRATRDANQERRKAGYETVELLGWAERPHYDAAGKKLFWAKRLRFEGNDGETVNYDVRVLGRSGVLVLQAVGDMTDLATVAAACKELLLRTEFVAGQRYHEFDANYDKVAAYGIGGLIAGKLLLKGGLLKLLLKPLLIVGGIAVAAVAKLFGAKRQRAREAAAAERRARRADPAGAGAGAGPAS